MAFKACGMLSKCLAGMVLNMQNMTLDRRTTDKLRHFNLFMKETVACQRSAWNATRFEYDENFNSWFSEPLEYKIRCLETMATEIDDRKFVDHEMVVFSVNKGEADAWNLLRIKVLFSDDNKKWQQMFFRTVPLWMSDDVSFVLMPERQLPAWIRLKFSCWTWRDLRRGWMEMLGWKIMKKSLCNTVPTLVETKKYEIAHAGDDDLLLRLVSIEER